MKLLLPFALLFGAALGLAYVKEIDRLERDMDPTESGKKLVVISFCALGLSFLFALWSMDANTVSLYNTNSLVFTVPIVLLITMKYSLNVEGESDGDPVEVLLHDKVLLGLCVVYLAVMFTILYL